MFETLRKLRARLSYKKKLRPYLAKTYGTRCDYSADEVRSGIEHLGLNPLYIGYGLALCSSPADFNSYHQAMGQDCSYESVRGEIGGDSASSSDSSS